MSCSLTSPRAGVEALKCLEKCARPRLPARYTSLVRATFGRGGAPRAVRISDADRMARHLHPGDQLSSDCAALPLIAPPSQYTDADIGCLVQMPTEIWSAASPRLPAGPFYSDLGMNRLPPRHEAQSISVELPRASSGSTLLRHKTHKARRDCLDTAFNQRRLRCERQFSPFSARC